MSSDDLETLLKTDGEMARRQDMSAARQQDTRETARALLADRGDVTDVSPQERMISLPLRSVLAVAAALFAAALLGVYVVSQKTAVGTGAVAGVDTHTDDTMRVADVADLAATTEDAVQPGALEDLGPLVPMAWPPPPPRALRDRPSAYDSFSHRPGAPSGFEHRSSTLKGRIREATRDLRLDLNEPHEPHEPTQGFWQRHGDVTRIYT